MYFVFLLSLSLSWVFESFPTEIKPPAFCSSYRLNTLFEREETDTQGRRDTTKTTTKTMGSSSRENESTMKVSKEEMKKAGIDLAYRDFCAHLLIPLNECRRKSFFLPWKCGDERHEYEKCQYEECVFYVLVFAFCSFFLLSSRDLFRL